MYAHINGLPFETRRCSSGPPFIQTLKRCKPRQKMPCSRNSYRGWELEEKLPVSTTRQMCQLSGAQATHPHTTPYKLSERGAVSFGGDGKLNRTLCLSSGWLRRSQRGEDAILALGSEFEGRKVRLRKAFGGCD